MSAARICPEISENDQKGKLEGLMSDEPIFTIIVHGKAKA
jgi:hypothetical protein